MSLLRASTSGLAIGTLLFASGSLIALAEDANPMQMCPQDAKICPDGSAVGRTGPNCSFAPCGGSGATNPGSGAPTPPKPPHQVVGGDTGDKPAGTNVPIKRPQGMTSGTISSRDNESGGMNMDNMSTATKMRMMEDMKKMGSSTNGKPGMMPPCAASGDGTPSPCAQGRGVGMGSSTPPKMVPIDLLMKRQMEMRDKLLHGTSTASSTRPALAVRNEWKKQWQETASSTKERVKEKVMIDVKDVTKRLSDAIKNLSDIADRVQSRTDKVAASGGDVTNATVALGDAKGALDAANTDLQTVMTNLNAVLTSTNPRDDFTKVQDSVNKVKVDIKAAYDALRKAVDALKQTTTPTTPPPAPTATPGDDQTGSENN